MIRIIYISLILSFLFCGKALSQDSTAVEEEEEILQDDEIEDRKNRVDTAAQVKTDEGPVKEEKKGPGKFLLAFEKFHFNFSSGYGLTRWQSQAYNLYDTAKVKYNGLGLNVPLHLQILFSLGKVRFGAGASMELYFMKKLKPTDYEGRIPEIELKGIGTFRKFYGHLGYKYFENRMYAYLADLEVGMYRGSPAVNTAGNGMRPFVNFGITLERKYSEYFRMFLKPAIEIKSQPFSLNDQIVKNHRLTTFSIQWGVSYSIPILTKCSVTGCKVRVHHYHGNRLFRGNRFSRLQNPEYGEEDKTMIKYRGKNKRRLEPF